MVNCIAIGGVFKINEKTGTFLTHESPTDYIEQQTKLTKIKSILDQQNATIIQIVLFRINDPSLDVYKNGLTTMNIIDLMFNFSKNLFNLTPIIATYSCDISNMKCGKAIISPTQYKTEYAPFKQSSPMKETLPEHNGTFSVDVLYNNHGDKIYKCPSCNSLSGTYAPKNPSNVSLFVHNYDCLNKNKVPIEK